MTRFVRPLAADPAPATGGPMAFRGPGPFGWSPGLTLPRPYTVPGRTASVPGIEERPAIDQDEDGSQCPSRGQIGLDPAVHRQLLTSSLT
jgi:hypothetical protein